MSDVTEPVYDQPAVSQQYFFPRPTARFTASAQHYPLRFRIPEGEIGALWCRYHASGPTVAFFYGNGETAADYVDTLFTQWIADAGANLMLVDYPGYGTSTGNPSLSGCCNAARVAVNFLLDCDEAEVPSVTLMGRSVGSIFALDAANTRQQHPQSDRVRGLIIESGIADLAQRMDIRVPYEALGISKAQFHQALEARFDHGRKIADAALPTLIMHCANDSLVPSWHASRLAEWAGPALYELIMFPEGDHNTIHGANADAYARSLKEFITRQPA